MEPTRILVLSEKSGLILNGSDEFRLRPVVRELGLTVVHGWRVRSTYTIGHDCVLLDDKFFAVTKRNSHEFVDFSAQVTLPAPSLGTVVDEEKRRKGGDGR